MKIEQYGEIIKVHEAKSSERKEKLKTLVQPFQTENESLRHEIKLLKKQLADFKNANEYVVGKLTRLFNKTNEETSTQKSNKSELDWSTYNDLLDDNDV